MHAEVEALIASPSEDHRRPTILGEFDYLAPEPLPNPSRHASAEDPWAYLKEPAGEVAAQPDRASGKDDDYHGRSSEKFWPAATRPW